jgi:small subunit ribosomal protein S2
METQEKIAGVSTDESMDAGLQEMMKAGLQFGHRKSRTHPKMKPFISGVRNTVHIIDLKCTQEKLDKALEYIKSLIQEKKILLIVGTKVQLRQLVRDASEHAKIPYVSERWIGGFFTNFEMVSKRIERLKEIEELKQSDEFQKYTKRERAVLDEEQERLERKFGGVKHLEKLPDAIFVCDLDVNGAAVKEAKMKGIPVIAIADTNTDPSSVDYAIPANDDAISSVKFILEKLKAAYDSTRPA